MSKSLSSNMEDYLETIYLIHQATGFVRVKEIASETGNSMPSVSSAVKNLQKRGLVDHPKYDIIRLTEKGEVIASRIYKRHRLILQFLQDVLCIKKEVAEQDACRIEHSVSDETIAGLERFMKESSNHSWKSK